MTADTMRDARTVFVLLLCGHWFRALLPPADFPHGGELVECAACPADPDGPAVRAVVATR